MYLIATVVLLDGEYLHTYIEKCSTMYKNMDWNRTVPGLDYWTAVRPHGSVTFHYTCVSVSPKAT